MPLHPIFGKMLLLAALFGVLRPVVTIVAALSNRSPFVHAIGFGAEKVMRETRWAAVAENVPDSDFILLLQLFNLWVESSAPDMVCSQMGLSATTMRETRDAREQYLKMLQDEMGFGDNEFFNRHAANLRLVSTVVAMCIYPNVAHRRNKKWWAPNDASFLVASPNSRAKEEDRVGGLPYLAFVERRALNKRMLVDNTTLLGLLPTVLSCEDVRILKPVKPEQESPLLYCDDWLVVRVSNAQVADTLCTARSALHDLVQQFCATRAVDVRWVPFLDALASAIQPTENARNDRLLEMPSFISPKERPQGFATHSPRPKKRKKAR